MKLPMVSKFEIRNLKFGKRLQSVLGSVGGFTMIELLVVIAVIGVLAVAVLSSINPIEQINKGRDTRTRSDAAQLINAVDRFFAIHEIYPWNDATYMSALTTDTLPSLALPDPTVCADNGNGFCDVTTNRDWIDALVTTAEVKQSFGSRLVGANSSVSLKVAKAGVSNATMFACFAPTSKAFQDEAVKGCVDRRSELPAGACSQASYNDTTLYVDELVCLP